MKNKRKWKKKQRLIYTQKSLKIVHLTFEKEREGNEREMKREGVREVEREKERERERE